MKPDPDALDRAKSAKIEPIRRINTRNVLDKLACPYHVVIPSKDPERWKKTFRAFMKAHVGFNPQRIVTVSGFDEIVTHPLPRVQQRTPFNTPQAWNEGLQAIPPEADLVILSDDVECVTPGLFDKLAALSLEMKDRAILMPGISGFDFNHALLKPGFDLRREFIEVPFICPYIPRRILKAVGPFDERYIGYGREDFDFSVRAMRLGYRIYVASFLEAYHVPGASGWRRAHGGQTPAFFAELNANRERMRQKFGFADQSECVDLSKEWAKIEPADSLG